MEELKVGEKVTLEAIEQDVCNGCDDCIFGYDDTCYNPTYNGCFFGYDDTCYNPTYNGWGDGFLCEPEERSDGKHVIFKEVKE